MEVHVVVDDGILLVASERPALQVEDGRSRHEAKRSHVKRPALVHVDCRLLVRLKVALRPHRSRTAHVQRDGAVEVERRVRDGEKTARDVKRHRYVIEAEHEAISRAALLLTVRERNEFAARLGVSRILKPRGGHRRKDDAPTLDIERELAPTAQVRAVETDLVAVRDADRVVPLEAAGQVNLLELIRPRAPREEGVIDVPPR